MVSHSANEHNNLPATAAGTFTMAEDLTVTRMGYGAMQLAGPHVFGPPADRDEARAVLRETEHSAYPRDLIRRASARQRRRCCANPFGGRSDRAERRCLMSTTTAKPVIGFIGLGDQGLPMATAMSSTWAARDQDRPQSCSITRCFALANVS
jgi:hypothetical protein